MKRKWVVIPMLVVAAVALWLTLAPPRWWLNLTRAVDLSDPVATGDRLVEQYDCRSCHRIAGNGSLKAPDLGGVTTRLSDDELRRWLIDPKAVKNDTAMPNFRLSDSEIEAIVAYLTSPDQTTP